VGSQPEQALASQDGFCSIMSAYNLLFSSIGNSVPLLSTVSTVHQTLHIMWTNLLLSVTLQDGQYVTVPLYTFHVNLYVHVVWCDTIWNWKVMCGNTVNKCMCWSWVMVQPTWHMASTYRSTWSIGGCTVPSFPPCTGVPLILDLPYWEHGHWMTSDANIVINGYHEYRWWG